MENDGFIPEALLSESAKISLRNNGLLPPEEKPKISEKEVLEARLGLSDAYYGIIEVLEKYLDMPEENIKVVSIWLISTYFHEQFETFPYLFFNAMRGSGKTRALKLISSLGNKGDGSVQNNLTEAVLFRIPRNTTTCIDEVEQIRSKEKQTLRELLNSAYKKGMKVKRMRKNQSKDGEKYVVETFEPFFPICMANITGVEEVLADRSIVLILDKSDNPGKVKLIEDFDKNQQIKDIKRTLEEIQCSLCSVVSSRKYIERWNEYISNKYTTTYNTLTTQTTLTTLNQAEDEEFFNKIDDLGITGRNLELFIPLLMTSKLIHDEVFNDIAKIASSLTLRKKEDEYIESVDVNVLEYCAEFGEDGFKSVKDYCNHFRQILGDSDKDELWINDRWFGRALKRLNLIKEKKRWGSGIQVMINMEKAKEKLRMFKNE